MSKSLIFAWSTISSNMTCLLGIASSSIPASNLAIPASNLAIPVSNLAIPAYNLAIPAYNLAIPAYNLAIPTSNLAIPASNLAIPASNLAFFAFRSSNMLSRIALRLVLPFVKLFLLIQMLWHAWQMMQQKFLCHGHQH